MMHCVTIVFQNALCDSKGHVTEIESVSWCWIQECHWMQVDPGVSLDASDVTECHSDSPCLRTECHSDFLRTAQNVTVTVIEV